MDMNNGSYFIESGKNELQAWTHSLLRIVAEGREIESGKSGLHARRMCSRGHSRGAFLNQESCEMRAHLVTELREQLRSKLPRSSAASMVFARVESLESA